MTLKIVNDSEHFVTFKKGLKIGHVESAIAIPNQEAPDTLNVFQTDSQPSSSSEQNNSEGLPAHLRQNSEQNDTEDVPAHLRQMFSDNITNLSDNLKSKFKNLLSEFVDVFSKDDFDLGCLNSGVEHKIQTHDEIPIAEKI